MDDVASTHHVVNCGFVFVLGVLVLAGSTGVIGIRAKSMGPAVVKTKCGALLLDGFALSIVRLTGLGGGEFTKAFIVGFGHVGD